MARAGKSPVRSSGLRAAADDLGRGQKLRAAAGQCAALAGALPENLLKRVCGKALAAAVRMKEVLTRRPGLCRPRLRTAAPCNEALPTLIRIDPGRLKGPPVFREQMVDQIYRPLPRQMALVPGNQRINGIPCASETGFM